jgi:hypothetical protein
MMNPQPMVSGALNEQDRAHLLERLEETRAEFERAVQAVPADLWLAGPETGGSWSLGQIAEHVAVTEAELLSFVRHNLLATPAVEPDTEQAQLDQRIPQAVLDPERRPQAPESVRPRGRWADAASLLSEFRLVRAATIEYVRNTRDPLRLHRVARKGLGNMDGYHWLLLLVSHTERHTRQMHERLEGK